MIRARTTGRPCETCRHPDRADIESALLAGHPFRAVARRHGLDHHAGLWRHAHHHMGAVLLLADLIENLAGFAPVRPEECNDHRTARAAHRHHALLATRWASRLATLETEHP